MKEIFKYITIFVVSIIIFWGGYFIFYIFHYYPINEKNVIIRLEVENSNGTLKNIQDKDLKNLNTILAELKYIIKSQEMYIKKFTNSQFLTVSNLNAFYSSLFTSIAVIAGILALGAWKTINTLNKKLDKLEKIESKVNFLHKKKDYAEWVKKTFDYDNDLTSSKLVLNSQDNKTLNEIQSFVENEITNNSWLEILLAKKMSDDGKYDEAIKIVNFIESRDLLKGNIKAYLFHFKAQFLWNKYLNGVSQKKDDALHKLLKDAIAYYEKALKENDKRDETYGNLAVVQIELAEKFCNEDVNQKRKILKKAINHLDQVLEMEKDTFNTYYDLARAKYLLDTSTNEISEEIKKLLLKSADAIGSKHARKILFTYLDERHNVFYPASNWDDIKIEMKKMVDEKKWLN